MAVRANSLKDVKIRKISLVDRGAARAPFKLTKRDGVVVDVPENKGVVMGLLDKVFKRAPKVAAPAVVAVMINKADDFEAVQARMKASGLELAEKTEIEGGGLVLHAADYAEDADDLILKFDDNFAAVVRGVQKGLLFPEPSSIPSWSFADDFTSNGILPGVDAALSAMGCAVWSAIYSADNPGDAAAKVGALFDEGKAYVNAVIGAIPSTAYKMDLVQKAQFPLTCAGSGVADATGKFPMEPGTLKPNQTSMSMGKDGGEQGVDPNKGANVAEAAAALAAVGGVHKGDGDTTGSAADGEGADKQANAGGNKVPGAKVAKTEEVKETGLVEPAPKVDAKAQTLVERRKEEQRPAATANDMTVVKASTGTPGGDAGFQKGTGTRSSTDGEMTDGAVDITAAPKGGGQAAGASSVIKDELAAALKPFADGLKAVMDGHKALTLAIKGIGDDLATVDSRVQKTEEGNRRIAATMRSTLQPTGDVEDEPVVHKNESNGHDHGGGLIDTAYDRRVQRGD